MINTVIQKLNNAFGLCLENKDTFVFVGTKRYANSGKTEIYKYSSENKNIIVLIDYDICKVDTLKGDIYNYSEITNMQNYFMNISNSLFRFLIEDIDTINDFLNNSKIDLDKVNKSPDRQLINVDSSPLEYKFEEAFINVYGRDSIKYLDYEYPILAQDGHSFYLDFFIHTKNGDIAIEENGIAYHHPQHIGIEKYKKQLLKQNVCAMQNIKLYRFSTEDLVFKGNIEDHIKKYVGEKNNLVERGLKVNRGFILYKHQNDSLLKISESRKNGIKTFLLVSPTASGKSVVALKDIEQFSKKESCKKILIIVPSDILKNDWEERIKKVDDKEKFTIMSYQYLIRHFTEYNKEEFDYIVVDEAHHFVAPVTKRMVQYFNPKFLLGITATPDRLDEKKLEEVFGVYEASISIIEAMKKRIIARARVFRLETNLDLSNVRINGKDYVNADLEKKISINSRNDLIADVIKRYFNNEKMTKLQGLIFCINQKHAMEVSKLLNKNNISSAAYISNNVNNKKVIEDFYNKKTRFLCVCDKVNEGWDYPELGILIMARPTLSKVLYVQQVGRGLRKTVNKDEVYIIDIVDQYGASVVPCSMHSIFKNSEYVPFGDITTTYHVGDIININGYSETIRSIIPVNIETFEDKYKDYINQQQLAIELFVTDRTVINWIKKNKIQFDEVFNFGNKEIYLFKKKKIDNIRDKLGLKKHDDSTIKEDFFDFLEERDYTFSYKMIFLKALLSNVKENGEAKIDDILTDYISFYKNRINNNLKVDKNNCPYNKDTLENRDFIQKNMLTNPFEKFERKKFMYYSKDIGVIQVNTNLMSKLTDEDFAKINTQMDEDLVNYYKKIK